MINKINLTRPDSYLAYNQILPMVVTYPMEIITTTVDKFHPMQTVLDKHTKQKWALPDTSQMLYTEDYPDMEV